MLRVWLRCALATAVAVACVILLTGPPQPPPPLSEQDVRIYVEVMPQIQRALGEIADKFEVARLQSRGDAEALGMQAAAQVDALLERHGFTRETWERLSKRVEQAVNNAR